MAEGQEVSTELVQLRGEESVSPEVALITAARALDAAQASFIFRDHLDRALCAVIVLDGIPDTDHALRLLEPTERRPVNIAKAFHETYENLAPNFGYETRKESAVPWDKVPTANRDLMVAVIDTLLRRDIIRPGGADA